MFRGAKRHWQRKSASSPLKPAEGERPVEGLPWQLRIDEVGKKAIDDVAIQTSTAMKSMLKIKNSECKARISPKLKSAWFNI